MSRDRRGAPYRRRTPSRDRRGSRSRERRDDEATLRLLPHIRARLDKAQSEWADLAEACDRARRTASGSFDRLRRNLWDAASRVDSARRALDDALGTPTRPTPVAQRTGGGGRGVDARADGGWRGANSDGRGADARAGGGGRGADTRSGSNGRGTSARSGGGERDMVVDDELPA